MPEATNNVQNKITGNHKGKYFRCSLNSIYEFILTRILQMKQIFKIKRLNILILRENTRKMWIELR